VGGYEVHAVLLRHPAVLLLELQALQGVHIGFVFAEPGCDGFHVHGFQGDFVGFLAAVGAAGDDGGVAEPEGCG